MKTVLFIGLVFPESSSTAAGSRMLQLLSYFKANAYKIVFASAAQQGVFSDDLAALIDAQAAIELNNASFDTFISDLNPNLVVFDRFISEEQFGWRVAEKCPDAIRILDTEDLHCLRTARQEAFKNNTTFNVDTLIHYDSTKRELASIYRCDLTLIISSVELELLTNHFGVSAGILLELPFLLPNISANEIKDRLAFEDRIDFMTIGNFKHEPNWQSVVYLKKTLWPLIRKQLPTARLLVYGAYPTQKVNDLHNEKEGFIVKGRAENAHRAIEAARVLLAPLQFGAGLKGKLIEAMQNGTPAVTTSIGAEGMYGDMEWNGFIEDNPVEFANKAVKLYTDKPCWLVAQQNGMNIVNKRFDINNWSLKFKQTLDELQSNLIQHRTHNVIGNLLQHHTLQSTKYLSKWIEEKNSDD
tara:strand:- start:248160 stop:249398 length:1239 start_codon:yes stop_codon:yes gene_type:complete